MHSDNQLLKFCKKICQHKYWQCQKTSNILKKNRSLTSKNRSYFDFIFDFSSRAKMMPSNTTMMSQNHRKLERQKANSFIKVVYSSRKFFNNNIKLIMDFNLIDLIKLPNKAPTLSLEAMSWGWYDFKVKGGNSILVY